MKIKSLLRTLLVELHFEEIRKLSFVCSLRLSAIGRRLDQPEASPVGSPMTDRGVIDPTVRPVTEQIEGFEQANAKHNPSGANQSGLREAADELMRAVLSDLSDRSPPYLRAQPTPATAGSFNHISAESGIPRRFNQTRSRSR
jgi:hypothetical protein